MFIMFLDDSSYYISTNVEVVNSEELHGNSLKYMWRIVYIAGRCNFHQLSISISWISSSFTAEEQTNIFFILCQRQTLTCSTFVFGWRRITDLCFQSKTKIDLSLADNEEQLIEDEEKDFVFRLRLRTPI